MARPENRDYTRDSCIRWSPERGLLIVEEKKEDGVISCQQIDPFDLYCALNEGYNNKDFLSSGFLPEHCLSVAMNGSERYFVLWNPELRADLTYLNTEYPDFPLPRLVFGIRMLNTGRIAECSIGVAADESPRPETAMYEYHIALNYEDQAARQNREQIENISTDLERLERVQYRLGYCVSQLPKPLSTIIQELYIRGKERKDIILELGLSESTFRRYRQKAIEDLAEMYLALQSAGVVLEWDD